MMPAAIPPQQLKQLFQDHQCDQSLAIIDIRKGAELTIEEALKLSSQQTIEQADSLRINYQKIFLLCEYGDQSQQLADLLGEPFHSIAGGFTAWLAAELPVSESNDKHSQWLNRYKHQISLPGFGEQAQRKLASAHVGVVGAGGLGAPALLYLVLAGVGKVTLIDDDQVVLSNLHRQILYDENDVGLLKTQQAVNKLHWHNHACEIKALTERLNGDNVDKLLHEADLVIDGSDNFATRYVINDYCLKNSTSWVFAGVNGFDLQVAVFGLKQQAVCLRCLFPEQEHITENSCFEAGVLGTVTGMAAMLQVTEAIKILAGLPVNLHQQMIHYNVLTHRFKMLKYPPDLQCPHR